MTRATTLANLVKSTGAHYTPPELAEFLARRALRAATATTSLSVLDPACGDGSLLVAIAQEAERTRGPRLKLFGMDRDAEAVERSRRRLAEYDLDRLEIRALDFLAEGPVPCRAQRFDLVIANPPYVRTQVLGAATSQRLAASLGLHGRVDLYHAFVAAMTTLLRPGGVLAILCSNRFLFTRAGQLMRRILAEHFHLRELIDLGDTKLFAAAVLPAIVIARKSLKGGNETARFCKVYAEKATFSRSAPRFRSVLAAIQSGRKGIIQVGSSAYQISRGTLVPPSEAVTPWRLTSLKERRFLACISRRSVCSFADVAKIRVGIKTTADSVFVRNDWHEQPSGSRPEPALLRSLLTHEDAQRWRAKRTPATRRVLYPHEVVNGLRRPIDLNRYPKARRYLEGCRAQLSARSYVLNAGRRWYELWVPQDPEGWSKSKLVAPDIREEPTFFLDESGAIVNGDCYWITLKPGQPPELLHLLLAIANSSIAVRFYDAACGNRLYSQRRRYMTQHLERFPLPDPGSPHVRAIVKLVADLVRRDHGNRPALAAREQELERLVRKSFGLAD